MQCAWVGDLKTHQHRCKNPAEFLPVDFKRIGLRSYRLALERSIDLNEDKRKSGGFGFIGWQGLCEMYISKSLWSDRGVSDTET